MFTFNSLIVCFHRTVPFCWLRLNLWHLTSKFGSNKQTISFICLQHFHSEWRTLMHPLLRRCFPYSMNIVSNRRIRNPTISYHKMYRTVIWNVETNVLNSCLTIQQRIFQIMQRIVLIQFGIEHKMSKIMLVKCGCACIGVLQSMGSLVGTIYGQHRSHELESHWQIPLHWTRTFNWLNEYTQRKWDSLRLEYHNTEAETLKKEVY